MPAVISNPVVLSYYRDLYPWDGDYPGALLWRIFKSDGCMGDTLIADSASPAGRIVSALPGVFTDPFNLSVTTPSDNDGSYWIAAFEVVSGGYGGDYVREYRGSFTVVCSDTLSTDCFVALPGGTFKYSYAVGNLTDSVSEASTRTLLTDGNTCNFAYGGATSSGNENFAFDYGAGTPVVANAFLLCLGPDSNAPTQFIVQYAEGDPGSAGTVWTTLKRFYSSLAEWQASRRRIFTFANATPHRCYRVLIETFAGNAEYWRVAECNFGMPLPAAPASAPSGAFSGTPLVFEAVAPALPTYATGLVLQWRPAGAEGWIDDDEAVVEDETASVQVHGTAATAGIDTRWKAVGCGGVSYSALATVVPPAAATAPAGSGLYHTLVGGNHKLRAWAPDPLPTGATSVKMRVYDVDGATLLHESAGLAAGAQVEYGPIQYGYVCWLAVNASGTTEGPRTPFALYNDAAYGYYLNEGYLAATPATTPNPSLTTAFNVALPSPADVAGTNVFLMGDWTYDGTLFGFATEDNAHEGSYVSLGRIIPPGLPTRDARWMAATQYGAVYGPIRTYTFDALPGEPPIPELVEVTAASATFAGIAFDPSWTGVTLQVRPAGGAWSDVGALVEDTDAVVMGLAPATNYEARYVAATASGDFAGTGRSFATTEAVATAIPAPDAPVIGSITNTTAEAGALSFDAGWTSVKLHRRTLGGAWNAGVDVTEDVATALAGLVAGTDYETRYVAQSAEGEKVGASAFFRTTGGTANPRFVPNSSNPVEPLDDVCPLGVGPDYWEVRDASLALIASARIGRNNAVDPGYKFDLRGSGQCGLFVPAGAVVANDYHGFVKTLDGRCAHVRFDVVADTPSAATAARTCGTEPPIIVAGRSIMAQLYSGACPSVEGVLLEEGWSLVYVPTQAQQTGDLGATVDGYTVEIVSLPLRLFRITVPLLAPDGVYAVGVRDADGTCYAGCAELVDATEAVIPPAPVLGSLTQTGAEASALTFDASWNSVKLHVRPLGGAWDAGTDVATGVATALAGLTAETGYEARYVAQTDEGEVIGYSATFNTVGINDPPVPSFNSVSPTNAVLASFVFDESWTAVVAHVTLANGDAFDDFPVTDGLPTTLTGLSAETGYAVRYEATTAVGQANSGYAGFLTPAAATLLPHPQFSHVGDISVTAFGFTWGSGEWVGIKLQKKTGEEGAEWDAGADVTENVPTDLAGLTPATLYATRYVATLADDSQEISAETLLVTGAAGMEGLTVDIPVVTDVTYSTETGELAKATTTLTFEDGVLTEVGEPVPVVIDTAEEVEV